MSKTDILITPAGGTSSVLLFLQPGATAIVMNYWDDATEKSVQIDVQNYWNLEYLDIQYFPVLLEDYEQTTNRPECEKPTDDEYYSTQVTHFCSSEHTLTVNAKYNSCQSSPVAGTPFKSIQRLTEFSCTETEYLYVPHFMIK